MRYAERTGQLSSNPFIYYKFSLEPVDPTSLTQEEVKRISQKKFSSKRLEEVRDIFVFSCWTGLSFSDVCSLEKNDIYIAFDEKPWIMVRRNEGNDKEQIPSQDIIQPDDDIEVALEYAMSIAAATSNDSTVIPTQGDIDRIYERLKGVKKAQMFLELSAIPPEGEGSAQFLRLQMMV